MKLSSYVRLKKHKCSTKLQTGIHITIWDMRISYTCRGTYTDSRPMLQCPATRCTWLLRSDHSHEISFGETFACGHFFSEYIIYFHYIIIIIFKTRAHSHYIGKYIHTYRIHLCRRYCAESRVLYYATHRINVFIFCSLENLSMAFTGYPRPATNATYMAQRVRIHNI